MLINKTAHTKLEEGKVFGFKLASGEEIIAKATKVTETTISVNRPHFLTQTPEGVAFAPALTMMSDKVDPIILTSSLLMYFEPDSEFSSAYTSAMAGIVVSSETVITK